MIYAVLRNRHTREAIHLEEQLAMAREAALNKARAEAEKMVRASQWRNSQFYLI